MKIFKLKYLCIFYLILIVGCSANNNYQDNTKTSSISSSQKIFGAILKKRLMNSKATMNMKDQ